MQFYLCVTVILLMALKLHARNQCSRQKCHNEELTILPKEPGVSASYEQWSSKTCSSTVIMLIGENLILVLATVCSQDSSKVNGIKVFCPSLFHSLLQSFRGRWDHFYCLYKIWFITIKILGSSKETKQYEYFAFKINVCPPSQAFMHCILVAYRCLPVNSLYY